MVLVRRLEKDRVPIGQIESVIDDSKATARTATSRLALPSGKTLLSPDPLHLSSKANVEFNGSDPIHDLSEELFSSSRLIPYVVLANTSTLLEEVPSHFEFARHAKLGKQEIPLKSDFADYFQHTQSVKKGKRGIDRDRGLNFAAYLQHQLLGLARVVELETPEFDRLSKLISSNFACPPAGFRLYWPGLSHVSRPEEHPVFTATSIRKRTDRVSIEESMRDELRLISTRGFRDGTLIRGARAAVAAARVARFQVAATLADQLATAQYELQMVRQSREELRRERDLLRRQILANRRESDDARCRFEVDTSAPTISASGLDEFTAELERTWDENARLRTEIDALRSSLAETARELGAVRENLASIWQSPEVPADPVPAPLVERTFAGIADALAMAAAEFNDILDVWDDAVRSAEESRFASPSQVFRAIRAMAEVGRDYFAARKGGPPLGPIDQAFEKRVPFKYSGFESQTTLSLFGTERVFRHDGHSQQMQRHLTLGGGNTVNCLQIYFEFDDDAGRVLVGYCGRHLPYFGRRT